MTGNVEIRRPQRWDKPFDPDMTDAIVRRVLGLAIFRAIDPTDFPPNLPLPEIIKNDSRIQRCHAGDIVVREGDYGNSLFIVLSGTVRVVTQTNTPVNRRLRSGSRSGRGRRSLLSALSQLWRNSRFPERRDLTEGPEGYDTATARHIDLNNRAVLPNYRKVVAELQTTALAPHQMFGETAALSRTPHTASVFADNVAELLELRWQGLRDIRRWSAPFRKHLDQLYRSRRLTSHLCEAPILQSLDDGALAVIAEQTILESHGDQEWFSEYKRLLSSDSKDIIKSEPVIAEAGDYVDGLIILRSGFGRITEQLGQGQRTVGFVTKNELFGFDEIIDHWRSGANLQYRTGLRAVGSVDLLRIPTTLVEEFLLPAIFPESTLLPPGGWRSVMPAKRPSSEKQPLEEPMLDFLVNNRTINGTAVMFINTDRCTACDDCVRACAAAHDNNPRFVRHGPEQSNLMVANACMHCVDPVCVIGCPTGAIHRNPQDGLVVIDDSTCIGCAICANTCPYDNIRMVETRDQNGGFIVDEQTRAPILKATKCDLCVEQPGGPACQRACPHDALIRLDARERRHLADWITR